MSTPRRSPLTPQLDDPKVCTPDVRQHVLAHVPVVGALASEGIADVDRRCRVEDFDAGNAVHHAGQPARLLHVVATGAAKVVRTTIEGAEVLLDIVRHGDFFGTLPVLGSDTYTDSVWALTPLCVLSLDAASFEAILEEHPSVARAGLGVMAAPLERAQSHIHALAAAKSAHHSATALLLLAVPTRPPVKGTVLPARPHP